MSEKEFWKLGEHYWFETSRYQCVGELVGFTNSGEGLLFRHFKLDRNPRIKYHDGVEEPFSKEIWVHISRVEQANLWEF